MSSSGAGRTLASGGALRLLSAGVAMGGALLVSVLLVRTLGVAQYGTYAFALSTVQLAGVIGSLGVGLGIARMASYYEGAQALGWAHASLRISIAGGLSLTGIVVALIPVVPSSARLPLLIASPIVFLDAIRSSQSGFLLSRRQVILLEGTNIGMLLATAALVYVAVFSGADSPSPILLVQVLTRAGAVLLLGMAWWRMRRGRAVAEQPGVREVLAFSLPLMLAAIATIVLSRSDVILLALLADSRAAGSYAPILQVFDVTVLIVASVGSYLMVVGPAFVRERDYARLRDAYTSITKWGMVMTLPLLVTLLMAPVPVLTTLFGQSFADSGSVSRVLSLGYIVNVVTGVNFIVLTALGATREITRRALAMIILNIALNAALIPRYGALGAALGTCIAMVSIESLNSLLIWRMAAVHPIRSDTIALLGGIVLSGLLAGLAVRAMVPEPPLVSSLVVFAVAQVTGTVIALLTLKPYERALIRSLLPSRRQGHAGDGE